MDNNYIDQACKQFRTLLEQQLERSARMDHAAKDFSAQKQVVIGLIDGDGIGPIIMREAKRVLEALLK